MVKFKFSMLKMTGEKFCGHFGGPHQHFGQKFTKGVFPHVNHYTTGFCFQIQSFEIHPSIKSRRHIAHNFWTLVHNRVFSKFPGHHLSRNRKQRKKVDLGNYMAHYRAPCTEIVGFSLARACAYSHCGLWLHTHPRNALVPRIGCLRRKIAPHGDCVSQ